MIKHLEVSNPHSCLNRARDDEPVFVLLGRDICAPEVIEEWVRLRVESAKNSMTDPQIKEALDLADQMRAWRERLAREQRSG